ncbi:hypothetical protein BH10BAC4_BH10BAC4_03270 [soil metagenome]
MIACYHWISNYIGPKEENFIGILRPRITVNLIKNISLGYEHFIYLNDQYLNDPDSIHLRRSEEKLILPYLFN